MLAGAVEFLQEQLKREQKKVQNLELQLRLAEEKGNERGALSNRIVQPARRRSADNLHSLEGFRDLTSW